MKLVIPIKKKTVKWFSSRLEIYILKKYPTHTFPPPRGQLCYGNDNKPPGCVLEGGIRPRRKRVPHPHPPTSARLRPPPRSAFGALAAGCLGDAVRRSEWGHVSHAGTFSEKEGVGRVRTFRAGCKCSLGCLDPRGVWKAGGAAPARAAEPETSPWRGPNALVALCPLPPGGAACARGWADSDTGIYLPTKTKLCRCIRQTARIDSGPLRRYLDIYESSTSPLLIGWKINSPAAKEAVLLRAFPERKG